MRLNLGNIYDDYFEYEIMKKYFIIWYISPDKTYEEEVSVTKYANAPEIYEELYRILYLEKFKYENEIVRHRIKHIDDLTNELITSASTISNSIIKNDSFDPFAELEINDFIHRSLPKKYQKIFVNYFFNGFSQEKIAKMEGLTQQAISHILRVSTNKLKNELEKFEKI